MVTKYSHSFFRDQAYKELGLLIILVGVAVLTFSSLVFYAEKDSPVMKWTFLDSFWWGLMTLTTGAVILSHYPHIPKDGPCSLLFVVNQI